MQAHLWHEKQVAKWTNSELVFADAFHGNITFHLKSSYYTFESDFESYKTAKLVGHNVYLHMQCMALYEKPSVPKACQHFMGDHKYTGDIKKVNKVR